jgi:methyl coenzyme M reductase subunit C-like uncharacterized protein (methanogenesis marker protein 7)
MHPIIPERKVMVSDTENNFLVIYNRNHPKTYGLYTTLLIVKCKKTDDVVIDFYNNYRQNRTGNESVGTAMTMMKGIFEDVLEYIETYSPSNMSFVLDSTKYKKNEKKNQNKFAKEQIFTIIANRLKNKTGHSYDKIITQKSRKRYQVKFNIIYNDSL